MGILWAFGMGSQPSFPSFAGATMAKGGKGHLPTLHAGVRNASRKVRSGRAGCMVGGFDRGARATTPPGAPPPAGRLYIPPLQERETRH